MPSPALTAPTLTADVCEAGFPSPVFDAQRTFRLLLDAMSRPGTVQTLPPGLISPPAPLGAASAAIGLTLFDPDTPVWCDPILSTDAIAGFLRFHCGCPLVDNPARAAFALIGDPALLPFLNTLPVGTDEEPETAATVIVQAAGLDSGEPVRLRGPGIETEATLRLADMPKAVTACLSINHSLYPRGLDWIFTCDDRFVALPRSTRLES